MFLRLLKEDMHSETLEMNILSKHDFTDSVMYLETTNEPHLEKTGFCLCENKGADQLRGNCGADQCLCFRNTDSTISLLLKSEISNFYLASVTVQAGLCRTWSEPKLLISHAQAQMCTLRLTSQNFLCQTASISR